MSFDFKSGQKNYIKIALTGGPCSGKTTSVSKIIEHFSSEYIVYTLPEVATITFSAGVTINPKAFNDETHKNFTSYICRMQMDLENYFESIARLQNNKVIIISDRGVCDNFAYCTHENKKKILEENGWTMNYLCNDRYDMVIHLVTAAIGAESAYTLENNSARSENLE